MTAAACGGTQGAAPGTGSNLTIGVEDASVDATLEQLDPNDPNSCQVFASLTRYSLMSFDSAPEGGGGRELIQTNSACYVSFDQTGTLLQASADGGLASVVPDPVACMTGFSCSNEQSTTTSLWVPAPVSHCGSGGFGLHLVASGLTNWGMNAGIDIRQNCQNTPTGEANSQNGVAPYCYFDGTGWTGISFWARLGYGDPGDPNMSAGGGLPATTLLITVADPTTASQLGGGSSNEHSLPNGFQVGSYPFNGPLDAGPLCGDYPCQSGLPNDNLDAGVLPCDPFGKGVSLPASADGGLNPWQFYAIPFSELRQKGYGVPESALDITHILNVTFNLSKGQLGADNYDLWIDDVAFYQ